MKMTKLEILDETVKYYKTHKRGLSDEGFCVNITNRGSMCAVGRCVDKELISKLKGLEDIAVGSLSLELGKDTTDECLQPQYRGHREEFWEDLQDLHDRGIHWSKNKSGGQVLTMQGDKAVELIKSKIRDGLYE